MLDRLVNYASSNWAIAAIWGVINIDRKIFTTIMMLTGVFYAFDKLFWAKWWW